MSDKPKFIDGLRFWPPHEKAPDFVVGKLSIQPNALRAWLEQCIPNDKGFVNAEIKKSREGKFYIALDEYQPQKITQDDSGPDWGDDGPPF